MEFTPEEQYKIAMVRLLVGDVPQSIFYPMLTDEEIGMILALEGWDVRRAARRVGMTIAFSLSSFPYRERTGDIEVWNNASIEYRKVLLMFLDDSGPGNLPSLIIPYAAGISKEDVYLANQNPDRNRSPLARITPCLAWWTEVENYDSCGCNRLVFGEDEWQLPDEQNLP